MPDPSFVFPLLLQSAVIPFLAASIVVVTATRLQRQARTTGAFDMVRPAPVLAVLLGFLASYFTILHAQWSAIPKQALDWLPWIAAATVPASLFAERFQTARARSSARAAIAGIAIALTAWPAIPGIGLLIVGIVVLVATALMCAAWTLLAGVARQRTALSLVTITSGASALTFMLEASQLLGQLAGALAAVLCALILAALLRRQAKPSIVPSGIAVLLLGTLLVHAYLYAGISLLTIALLSGGLLAAAFALSLEGRGIRRARAACVLAATLCAVPCLIAVALAVRAMQESGGY